jgi:hypothetical protein
VIISYIDGEPSSGVRVELIECQYNWFWMYRQVFYAMNDLKSQIYISLYSDTSYAFLKTCEISKPARACCACKLFVNYDEVHDKECSHTDPYYFICNCSLTDIEPSSWGAIKSIIK